MVEGSNLNPNLVISETYKGFSPLDPQNLERLVALGEQVNAKAWQSLGLDDFQFRFHAGLAGVEDLGVAADS